jgi:hypothetical protein
VAAAVQTSRPGQPVARAPEVILEGEEGGSGLASTIVLILGAVLAVAGFGGAYLYEKRQRR